MSTTAEFTVLQVLALDSHITHNIDDIVGPITFIRLPRSVKLLISCPHFAGSLSYISLIMLSQKEHLESLLKKLGGLIKNLPTSLPCGAKEGPIVKHFSNLEHDISQGPYFTFNNAWERVFQVSEDEKHRLVIRGKHGLNLVQAYLVHFSKVPGLEANNGLFLMAERVNALIKRIEAV